MIEPCSDLEQSIRNAAVIAIRRCAQGLLTVDMVSRQVKEELETQSHNEPAENQAPQKLLNRLALRFCSRILYLACCSPHAETRNCAYTNLNRYLEQSLHRSNYAHFLAQHADAAQDVVQETLRIVQIACMRYPPDGPDDPAAFLKWTLTILLRQAYAFATKSQQETTLSLDAQCDAYTTSQIEDQQKYEPEAQFDSQELQEALKNAILSLSNLRYQQVLFGTFLAGMEERELATLLGVQVQEVYLWRHRAIKALRSKREVVDALRAWLR
ncbi:MAG TPA: sigma-70 family RNA polymerase sigma factor [Ktedonobacteraceae bacterium]|nr:sigma-70 family RNA polymerase sigma factor [Ktedonobacteraceae bacterium]